MADKALLTAQLKVHLVEYRTHRSFAQMADAFLMIACLICVAAFIMASAGYGATHGINHLVLWTATAGLLLYWRTMASLQEKLQICDCKSQDICATVHAMMVEDDSPRPTVNPTLTLMIHEKKVIDRGYRKAADTVFFLFCPILGLSAFFWAL